MQKKVITFRADGLGSRLIAIINGLHTADVLGLPFKFTWPPIKGDSTYHSVPPAEELFSKEFLDQYYEPFFDLTQYLTIVDEPLTKAIVDQVVSDEKLAGINMMVCENTLQLLGMPVPKGIWAEIWQRIKFSASVEAVIAHAKSSVPPGAKAIHIRRGDTVYGDYRMRLFNGRFIPLSYVKTVVKDEISQGSKIILFSDDNKILTMLRDRYEIQTTADMGVNEYVSNTDQAFFDFTVMSQCTEIIAIGSAFSILAGLIGAVNTRSPRDAFDRSMRRQAVFSDIESNPNDYSDLEKAKELQWVANELTKGLPPENKHVLLSEAYRLDPNNQTYAHLIAMDLARAGRFEEADAILGEAAETYFNQKGGRGYDFIHPFNNVGDRITKQFVQPATIGCFAYISLFYAFQLAKKGSMEMAAIMAHRAHLLRPDSDAILAYYVHVAYNVGHNEEVRESLLEAVNTGRDKPIFLRQLTDVFDKLKDKKSAVKYAAAAFTMAPDDMYLRTKYSFLLVRTGRIDEARELIKNVLASDTDEPAALYQLSKTNHACGDVGRARACAEKAVILRPRKPLYKAWLQSLQ